MRAASNTRHDPTPYGRGSASDPLDGDEMNKRNRLWSILLLLPLMSGCSWLPWFLVVNKTSGPIVIGYTLAGEGSRLAACPDNYFITKPKITTIKAIGDAKVDTLPDAKYSCDPNTRKVTFQLNPEEAAYLFEVSGYHGFRTDKDFQNYTFMEYPIKSITIESQRGKIEFTDSQVTRDFLKVNNSLYMLTYE